MNYELNTWLSLFPGATREHPRFMALAEAVLRQAADLAALVGQIQPGFSFAAAEGKQLDDIAGAVGLARPNPDCPDGEFRAYLLAKLALWSWDGTNGTLPEIPGCSLSDNGDGTVTVTGEIPEGAVLPVPAGVRAMNN